MISKALTFFVISNEPWGEVWFSKHHYANELSRMGHKVFFVNPINKWSVKNLFSFKTHLTKFNENLTIVDYKNNFPLRIFPSLFQKLNDQLNYNKLLKRTDKANDIVFWQFDVFRFVASPKSKSIKRIFHIADSYINLPNNGAIAQNSELLVITSVEFIDFYQKNFPKKKMIHIPHGVSENEFQIDKDAVQEIKEKYRDFSLLTGSISDNINFSLLIELARQELNIVIIGTKRKLNENNEKLWDKLISLNNVFYIGVVNGQNIKNWISASKICLVVYNFNISEINNNSNSSLKILNYLAQKKAIISSVNGEISTLKDNVIFVARDEKTFIYNYREACNESLKVEDKLINEYLSKHHYPMLINQILESL